MHLHHPEIAKDWERKYKDGGFVEDSKEANKAGDVVDAKLAIGEVILNGKHLEKVEEMTGIPAEQFWAEVGVPGFEGGQNPLEAKGGGVATKKDYLMKYKNSGVAPKKRNLAPPFTGLLDRDYNTLAEKEKQLDWWLEKVQKPVILSGEDPNIPGNESIRDIVANRAAAKEAREGAETQIRRKDLENRHGYQTGGVSKKDYLMKYKNGGVGMDGTGGGMWGKFSKGILEDRYPGKSSYDIDQSGNVNIADLINIQNQLKAAGGDTSTPIKYGQNGDKTMYTRTEAAKNMEWKDVAPMYNYGLAKGGVAKKKKKKKKRGY